MIISNSTRKYWRRDLSKNKYKYLMFLPVAIYFIVFCYKPMYGIQIAFRFFKPTKGITGSEWTGLENFVRFFSDFYFGQILTNTFIISFLSLIWGFPIPIVFALLLNEMEHPRFKKLVQTSSYLPHFISIVVVCSMIKQFALTNGLFNDIAVFFGGSRTAILANSDNFRTIYVASGVWQSFGWNSIIYLAALSGIDQELYEAAKIDGAGRFRQLLAITLPGILPTITMLLILNLGSVLNVGSEKILLLYSEATYKTADVISTYVYRKGMINAEYSFSTAVGLFNSVVNVVFLLTANYISKKTTETSIF